MCQGSYACRGCIKAVYFEAVPLYTKVEVVLLLIDVNIYPGLHEFKGQ